MITGNKNKRHASKLSKAKKRIKVEPLFNKFELPDSWRLSYRRG